MPTKEISGSTGRALTPGANALMLMLCLSWGFNQIAVKLALADVPPMLQALIRSAGALPVMLLAGWLRGVKFFRHDGTLVPGLFAGVLFGVEFVLIFSGLVFTSASRAAVFLYTAPFFVALGSYQFLGERLSLLQWSGLGLSFAGVALAIGVPQPNVDAKVRWAICRCRRRSAVGRDDADRRHAAAQRGAEKALATRSRCRSRSRLRLMAVRRDYHPYPGALSISLLAYQAVWWLHLRAVVRAGEDLFGE
jgi:uncharacterized membrane protein